MFKFAALKPLLSCELNNSFKDTKAGFLQNKDHFHLHACHLGYVGVRCGPYACFLSHRARGFQELAFPLGIFFIHYFLRLLEVSTRLVFTGMSASPPHTLSASPRSGVPSTGARGIGCWVVQKVWRWTGRGTFSEGVEERVGFPE